MVLDVRGLGGATLQYAEAVQATAHPTERAGGTGSFRRRGLVLVTRRLP